MILFYQPGIQAGALHLTPDESRHCVTVLRKKSGDKIDLTDGRGTFYEGIIQKADSRQCTFSIIQQKQEPPRKYNVHIALSPTKNAERTERFVEKSVEIGIDQISFIQCRHTERTQVNRERMERVAVSAMKQSLKAMLPTIDALIPFADFLRQVRAPERFIAVVDPENPQHLKDMATSASSYCVLIGPEGDFIEAELALALDHGFKKVSLGKSRLRTETAAVAACHVLNLINW